MQRLHGRQKVSSKERGLHCERLVKDKLLREGHIIIAERLKTPFGELDIFTRAPEDHHFWIVEVKSGGLGVWAPFRVGRRQKQRLRNVCLYMQDLTQSPVRGMLALVESKKSGDEVISLIPDFLG